MKKLNLKKLFKSKVFHGFLFLLWLVILVSLWISGFSTRNDAANTAYQQAKESQREIRQNELYSQAFIRAEEAYHVSNEMMIYVGPVKEEQKLEVLKVFDIEYKVYSAKNLEHWMEVPGMGVFVVDLEQAEFIVNNEERSVLVRLPQPIFTDFTIDTTNVDSIYTEGEKASASEGFDIITEQLKEAQTSMFNRIKNNQEYVDSAMQNALIQIRGLIYQFNPDIPDLEVTLEWID